VYLILCVLFDAFGWLSHEHSLEQYMTGWGVPTATDISVAWVTSLCVFGAGHPAINYLLLLAVIDDGIGLMIIAFAYPNPEYPLQPAWLSLVILGMAIAFALRWLRCTKWGPYIFLAGPVVWVGLLWASLHPSLALVFVVPFIPLHLEDDLLVKLSHSGHESSHHEPLHDFEEATKLFVDFFVLFAFGAVNAGVQVDQIGGLTGIVLLSLVIGKTCGIVLASWIAERCGCPPGASLGLREVTAVGFIASSGLTVALFISGQAFEEHPLLDGQAKMGALLSAGTAMFAIGCSLVCGRMDGKSISDASPSEATSRWSEIEDETLEEVIVGSTMAKLKEIQATELALERKKEHSVSKSHHSNSNGSTNSAANAKEPQPTRADSKRGVMTSDI